MASVSSPLNTSLTVGDASVSSPLKTSLTVGDEQSFAALSREPDRYIINVRCATQSRNLCNLENPEIVCQSRDCALGLIAWHHCTISRLRGTGAQSGVSTISVACTIEPFEFPSYITVRDVRNKLLQLRRHLQCRACILKPPYQGLLGSSPTRRNSPRSGYRSQTRGVPPFKASPSLKVLNSPLLVSLDALTR